jgi:quercetin dioxygenase-like cupin family protein
MMSVKHVEDVEKTKIEAGSGVTKQVIISPEEGPNFAMRRFVIQPGGGMPKHTNQVEHEQYVLSGEAEIAIGDETYHVREGDVVFIPANVPHWYKNHGEDPFIFLCVVPNDPDKITLLEA